MVAALAFLLLITAACSPSNDGDPPSDEAMWPGAMDWLGGPIMPVQSPEVEDIQKVLLGKALFNDKRLSGDGSRSCASCHDLSSGGDDGRRVAAGMYGRMGRVNTPTVLNSSLNFAQFWDGRARTLEEQITVTVEDSIEMDGNWSDIEERLRSDASMIMQFAEVYERPVSKNTVVEALAAYLGVLVTPDAPFDRFLKGDRAALTVEQRAGYDLFVELGCVSCHQGQNIGGNLFQRFGVMEDLFSDRDDLDRSDLGRYNFTGREQDRHLFKVPSLRNVAETAPYFHDGSAKTLEEAIEIMIQYQLGRVADSEEVRLLEAFLETLSGRLDERWR